MHLMLTFDIEIPDSITDIEVHTRLAEWIENQGWEWNDMVSSLWEETPEEAP